MSCCPKVYWCPENWLGVPVHAGEKNYLAKKEKYIL